MGTTIDEYPNQGNVRKADPPPFDMPAADAQFMQAVEAALERSDATQRAIVQRQDQLERVLLWVAKQPWEVDAATTWDELVAKASAEPAKAMKFRETVVTPPPVRDIL